MINGCLLPLHFYYIVLVEANRLILLKENAFDTIVDVLKNSTHADSIKNACGALLNTTMSCGKCHGRHDDTFKDRTNGLAPRFANTEGAMLSFIVAF